MTGRSTRPQTCIRTGSSGTGSGLRLRPPSSPESAREIFGRFVRTLEQLDAARGTGTPVARQQKADITQSWEVTGCGRS